MALVTLQQTRITNPGGGAPIKLLSNNSARVFFFLYGTVATSSVLCLGPAGASTTGFWPISTLNDPQHFRKFQYGELVTGEIWLSTIADTAPNCDVVVTEGTI